MLRFVLHPGFVVVCVLQCVLHVSVRECMSTIVQGCASKPKPELSSNTEFLGLGTHANARDRLIGVDQHLVLAPLRQVVKGLRLVVQLQRGLLDAGHCNVS